MIPWQRAPLIRPVIALIIGVATADWIRLSPNVTYLFMGVITACVLIDSFSQLINLNGFRGLYLLMMFYLLGNQITLINKPNDQFVHGAERYYDGVIMEEPIKKKRLRAFVEIKHYGDIINKLQPTVGTILVYFGAEDTTTYRIGDQVIIKGKLQPISPTTNPYAFDYQNYLHNRGVDYQIFASSEGVVLKNRAIGIDKNALFSKLRKASIDRISEYLPDSSSLGIVAAMLLGYRNMLPDELYQAFTDTGAVHTLAVSGLHVGIVASLMVLMMGWFPGKNKKALVVKSALTICAIWLYAMLAGASPSVIRASIMFSFLTIDFQWAKHKNMYNILAASAFIMIVNDPMVIYQASFQFSFLALLGILLFYRKIYKSLPYIKRKPIRWFWGLTAVSFAAQLAVFPVTIYYFHKFPTYFWLSSAWAIPLTYVVILLGIMLLISSFILPFLSNLIGMLLHEIITLLNKGIKIVQALPMSSNDNIWLNPFEMISLYGVILLLAYSSHTDNKWPQKMGLTILVALSLLRISNSVAQNFQASVMVYDTHEVGVVDFIYGKNVISYRTSSNESESENYATQNYRIAVGMKNQQIIKEGEQWTSSNLFIKDNVLILRNKVFVFAQSKSHNYHGKVDYLIINSKDFSDPYDLIKKYTPLHVIVGRTIGKSQLKAWRSIQENTSNIRFIQDEGAIKIEV